MYYCKLTWYVIKWSHRSAVEIHLGETTMLDHKHFGNKLRSHRKKLGFTQEEVAEFIGVSPQAISKWEAGDCLPDCYNLKAICKAYGLSADILLETEKDGDLASVTSKIEQLATEFVWSDANKERYNQNLRKELGNDLWEMWKVIYFTEIGDRKLQQESKVQGNLRIIGSYGAKVWDDDGIACVVQCALGEKLLPPDSSAEAALHALCTEEGRRLIVSLSCDKATSKQEIMDKTGLELNQLNSLLLLLIESNIITFETNGISGYKISGHCGVAAYMVIAATHILSKKRYSASEFFCNCET